jgi:O-antigen/teichoic acid export membrane protein
MMPPISRVDPENKGLIRKIGGFFFKSKFSKDIAVLASSSFVAQGINFLCSIFLTRLYLPEYFGTLSVFLILVSFIGIVSTGKFDVALVAARDNSDAKKLFSLSFLVLFAVVILCFIGISIIYLFDLNFYKGQPVRSWLYFILPSLVFLTGTQVFWMMNVRDKNFQQISYIRIAEAMTNGGLQLILFSLAANGLLIGTLVSQFISFIILAWIVRRNFGLSSFIFSFKELKETFMRYLVFPKINILQAFLDMFQVGMLVLLLAKYYGPEVTGYYSMCWRVLQLPMRLLILPVSHVFFAEASERFRNSGRIYTLVLNTIKKSFLMLVSIPIILIIIGPWLFSIIFGGNWREAGVYAQILSIWIFFDLIRAPIIQVTSILGKQKQLLILAILNSLLFLAVIFIGSKLNLDVHNTLWLVSFSQAFMCIVQIVFVLKISRK